MCKSNALEVLRALDAVEEVQSALRGFDELLTPGDTAHAVARDPVACLFNYLVRQQDAAQAALRAALFPRPNGLGNGGAPC